MPIRDNKPIYFATVMVFVLMWSSSFVAAKVAMEVAPPLLFLGLRFSLAGLILFSAYLFIGGRWPQSLGDWAKLAILGVLNQAGFQGLAWIAMGEVSSGLAAVIISMNPIFVALLAVPILGEQMTVRRGLGLALGIVGVVIVLNSRIAISGEDIGGIILMIFALASVVLGAVLFKKWKMDVALPVNVGMQFVSAGVLLFAFGLFNESFADVVLGWHFVGIMAYIVIGVSIGGVGLWFYLLSHGSASDASALHFLMPPFGLMFGWLILDEQTVLGDFIGIVPIAVGIWLATHTRHSKLEVSKVLVKA
ncbi:MAG: DMT family transporter [Magnetovibrio sp.]|nr:DMT family transporter [Magnetovibrio sp.]